MANPVKNPGSEAGGTLAGTTAIKPNKKAQRVHWLRVFAALLALAVLASLVVGCDLSGGPVAAPATISECGNGYCGQDENYVNCYNDCYLSKTCGNHVCDPLESASNCQGDCVDTCGNEFCGPSESVINCSADCTCGNGTCDPSETPNSCPQDCSYVCGDGVCGPTEDTASCPLDCPWLCGNGTCDWTEPHPNDESVATCPQDCASKCGNDVCDFSAAEDENFDSCPQDCPSLCGNGHCDSSVGNYETLQNCGQDCSWKCGDGYCGQTETTTFCPWDCTNKWCGDGICRDDESAASCPFDCQPPVAFADGVPVVDGGSIGKVLAMAGLGIASFILPLVLWVMHVRKPSDAGRQRRGWLGLGLGVIGAVVAVVGLFILPDHLLAVGGAGDQLSTQPAEETATSGSGVCGSSCSANSDCTAGYRCLSNTCWKEACDATNPPALGSGVCGSTCSTNEDCTAGYRCLSNACWKEACDVANPPAATNAPEAGLTPTTGCHCEGTTLYCTGYAPAEFNPECGVGGGGGNACANASCGDGACSCGEDVNTCPADCHY